MEAAEEGRAAIVSEFAPDSRWHTHAAVTRNATISALSRLVCVIEPRKTGGSVRTARCGLEQGKQVLVHGSRDPESPIAALRRAGAGSLLDEQGQFSGARLQDRWRNPPATSASQADLF
jgi:predicted Rossmann fold nucleotide-binding protein DprA/Smf involved in DNA uptake